VQNQVAEEDIGCIVVNGDGGVGVDIFFALEDATAPGRLVVFVDQRKRRFGKFQPSQARAYLHEMARFPVFLEDRALFVSQSSSSMKCPLAALSCIGIRPRTCTEQWRITQRVVNSAYKLLPHRVDSRLEPG
jgi:hypothetical protein